MTTDYYKMGLGLGGAYFEGKEEKREREYLEEKRAREKLLQTRQDEQYTREQTQRTAEDAAVSSYERMQTAGMPNRANIQANDADFDAAVEATGRGLAMPAAAPVRPDYTPATALDRNQGLQGIARARRDWNGVNNLQQQEPELLFKQEFGRHLKEYTGTPEQIEFGTRHINTNSKSLTLGMPGKDGLARFSIAQPDGQSVFGKLSRQDQAQMYAAGQLMEQDPARALAIMSGINKDLAAAIAADNNLTKFLGDNNNDVAGKSASMQTDKERVAIARAGLALRRQGGGGGSGSGEKPEDTGPNWKSVEDGKTRHDERSGRTQTFTNGEWVDMGGVSAAELPQWMDANDLPPGSEMLIQRLPTGHVMIPDAGDAVYEPGNPRHVKELKAALARVTQVMERNGSARPPVQNDPRNESAFEQRRTALMAQEQARQQALAQQATADRAAREAAAEQERQRRLAARPDLNQMGLRPMTQ